MLQRKINDDRLTTEEEDDQKERTIRFKINSIQVLRLNNHYAYAQADIHTTTFTTR